MKTRTRLMIAVPAIALIALVNSNWGAVMEFITGDSVLIFIILMGITLLLTALFYSLLAMYLPDDFEETIESIKLKYYEIIERLKK